MATGESTEACGVRQTGHRWRSRSVELPQPISVVRLGAKLTFSPTTWTLHAKSEAIKNLWIADGR
jgi:hypothetical protein